MKPYYEEAGVTLYHGDSREILPRLRPQSVDLVVTDPPYGVGYSTGYRQRVVRSSTRLANDHMLSPLLNDTAQAVVPLLNDTAALYVFAAPERLDTVMPVIRQFWTIVNTLVWDKGNCTAGDLQASYGEQWEAVLFARAARSRLVGGRDRDILRFSRGNTNAYLHPTQKPLSLISYLVNRHPPGAILDPFAGSGTTLLAAKNLGRRAIGVEIDERYCDLIAQRLSQEVLPLDEIPSEVS